MSKTLELAPAQDPFISKVCFWLVAFCGPLSLLAVYRIPRGVLNEIAASAPRLHFILAAIRPHQPGWLQYFAVQTTVAVVVLCGALACVRRGRDWWRPGRIGRHVFLVALAAYVVWAVLGCFRAAWPYGAWRHVIREMPFYALAAAAMLVCGTQRRWVTLAKVYVGGVLAASLIQEILILQSSPRTMTPLWTMATAHPLLYGIPLLLAGAGGLGLAVSAAACWAAEDTAGRRIGCRWFLVAAASCLAGLMLLLGGMGVEALPGLGGIMPRSESWFRALNHAFFRNAYMFGNMNLCAPIALTASYATMALTYPHVAFLFRFSRESSDPDGSSQSQVLFAALYIAAGIAALGVLGFLFVCAGSLAGWVALAVSGWAFAVCLLPLKHKKLQISLGLAPVVLGMLVGLTILCVPALRTRTWNALIGPGTTLHLRVVYWWAATDMFLERPLTGWGAEGFPALFAKYRPALASKLQFVQFTRPTHPHNEYMRLLCEHGFVGALCYLSAVGYALVSSFMTLRRKEFRMRMLGYALWAGALAFCVQSTFGLSQKGWTFAISFWLLIGVLASAAHGLPEAASGPEGSPPPASKSPAPPKSRIVAEGWLVLTIVACLLGWGWWEWGIGAWRSQIATAHANGMRARMNVPHRFHPLFSQFARMAERSRPRSLWPPQAIYNDYLMAWTLTDKDLPPVAFQEAVFMHREAPELLHTRLFLARNHRAMGRMGDARSNAIRFIELNPFAPRGYEVLADIDLPICVFMLRAITGAAEQDMAAQALRLPLARYATRLHQQLDMHRDVDAFLQEHPDSLAAHNLSRLLSDMTRWEPESTQKWHEYVANDCTPAKLKALAAESADKYCNALSGIRRVIKASDYHKQHGIIKVALAVGDVAPGTALRILGATTKAQSDAVGKTVQELKALGMTPPGTLLELRRLGASGNSDIDGKLAQLLNQEVALLRTVGTMAEIADKRGDERGADHARAVLKLDPDNMAMWELLAKSDLDAAVRQLTAHLNKAPGPNRTAVARPGSILTLCKLMKKQGKQSSKTILATLAQEHNRKLRRISLEVFRFLAAYDKSRAITELRRYTLRVPTRFGPNRPQEELDRTARRWAEFARTQPILSLEARWGFNETLHWLSVGEYRILLADMLVDAGHKAEAVRHIEQCLALDPRSTAAWRVFFKANPELAVSRLENVVATLQLVPGTHLGAGTEATHLPTLRLLLECLVRLGGRDDAVAALIDTAKQKHGIEPYVLIVPAAAELEKAGLTKLATELRLKLTVW